MIARQEKARAHLSDNFIVEVRSAMSQVEGMKHSRLYSKLYCILRKQFIKQNGYNRLFGGTLDNGPADSLPLYILDNDDEL